MKKETEFYNKLQDIFVGAKVDGEGGFINLMRMKSGYYEQIKKLLLKDVVAVLKTDPDFREELFDKLYSFFNRYFTQNGSIAFNDTAFHNNVYEKVYTNNKDVALFWKTQMLYYVKTDSLYESMPVELDNGIKFYFDCGKLEYKKSNEKKTLIFTLADVSKNEVIILDVSYAKNGCQTKTSEILSALREKGEYITEEELETAIRIFKKQVEVDFFINKNAKDFLQEQFKLWSYQYFWDGAKEWKAERVNQLNMLRTIAYKIIDFIAEFEDELVRVWNKPKFVKNSNYVITLDRLNEKLLKKIKSAKGYKEQLAEWQELGIDENNPKAPIDTKFFKELELEILSQFDDLDEALDGWLIKSENYQALNTILPKFKGKVQTIYIDPPFNLGTNADYEYNVNYKDSNWATILENRLDLGSKFLKKSGAIFARCDYNGNFILRMILDAIFEQKNFRNEIKVKRGYVPKGKTKQLPTFSDSLFFFCKDIDSFEMIDATRPLKETDRKWISLDMPEQRKDPSIRARIFKGNKIFPPKNSHWGLSQERIDELDKQGDIRINEGREYIDTEGNKVIGMPEYFKEPFVLLNSNWDDISGYSTHNTGFKTENSEKLLNRVEKLTSRETDLILDFFLGSGTTIAVAHKLNRKWIGVELGDHFDTIILPRMKEILANEGNNEPYGISEEVNWQGGGFFKYYELEQYEEVLKHCKYVYVEGDEPETKDLLYHPDTSAYEQYVFMHHEKMLKAIEVNHENNEVNLDLNRLYDNIDLAETLSNYMGKSIKSITKEEVIFSDGSRENLAKPDYRKVKPLIWWER